MITRFVFYIAVMSIFSSCSYTRNWQGTSNSEATQAQFKELTGRQVFTLHVPSNDTYLAYRFNETDGELVASIKSPAQVVFTKEIDISEANSVHLVNQKGAEYKVSIKGKRASGAFDVRFVSAAK